MKQSLKGKLLLVFILVISIPLLVLGILSYSRSAKAMHKTYELSNAELVKEVEYGVNNYMNAYKLGVEIFASNETTKNVYTSISAKKMVMAGFETFLAENPNVLFLYMGTERKEMLDPSWDDIPDDYDPTTRPWYIGAKESQTTSWTEPYPDEETGLPVVSVSTPVYDKAKKVYWCCGNGH